MPKVTFDDDTEVAQEWKIEAQSGAITQALRKCERALKEVVEGGGAEADERVRRNIQVCTSIIIKLCFFDSTVPLWLCCAVLVIAFILTRWRRWRHSLTSRVFAASWVSEGVCRDLYRLLTADSPRCLFFIII